METADYRALRDDHVLQALARERSLIFARAENARLWDTDGALYLDTMSGSAGPAMVGHANPRVAEAAGRQLATLPTVGILHQSTPVIELCARMARIAPAGLDRTFLCAGGGEAIETALKLAMRITGRREALSLSGAYHGMSLATMSLNGMAGEPWVGGWPGFRQVPSGEAYRPPLGADGAAGSLRALEAELAQAGGRVAALVVELVQGPNGHAVFEAPYYAAIQELCRRHGVLLVVDEIQTGLGRCGELWACDIYGVRPDILAIGKAFGGGVPIGAVLARSEQLPAGLAFEPWQIMTFMNQPLAAAAALAVLDVIEDEGLVERARRLGAEATARFRALAERYDAIGDVRGPGLFIGIDYVLDRATREPATAICRDAWERALDLGLLVQFGGAAGNVLKFKPPLTTPADDFAAMLDRVAEVSAYIQERVDASR